MRASNGGPAMSVHPSTEPTLESAATDPGAACDYGNPHGRTYLTIDDGGGGADPGGGGA